MNFWKKNLKQLVIRSYSHFLLGILLAHRRGIFQGQSPIETTRPMGRKKKTKVGLTCISLKIEDTAETWWSVGAFIHIYTAMDTWIHVTYILYLLLKTIAESSQMQHRGGPYNVPIYVCQNLNSISDAICI